jgi:hypothetical protein
LLSGTHTGDPATATGVIPAYRRYQFFHSNGALVSERVEYDKKKSLLNEDED